MSRILLDQNCPRRLREFLAGREVRTAAAMGWAAIENGELLRAAEDAGFAVLVTADRNMRHQQNLRGRAIALVVLPTNFWPTVRDHGALIAQAVNQARPGDYVEVRFRMARQRNPPVPKSKR